MLLILLRLKHYTMRLLERTRITMAASTGDDRLLVDYLYTAVPGIQQVSYRHHTVVYVRSTSTSLRKAATHEAYRHVPGTYSARGQHE